MKKNRMIVSMLSIAYMSMLFIMLAIRNLQFKSDDNFMVFAILLSALPLIGLYIVMSNERPMRNGILLLLVLGYVLGISGIGCRRSIYWSSGVVAAIAIFILAFLLHMKSGNERADEQLHESHLLMMFSHFQYVFYLIFLFFEATTNYSIVVGVLTVLYLISIRAVVKKAYDKTHRNSLERLKFILVAVLEFGILSMLFLLIPYHNHAKIAYLLSSNAIRLPLDRGIFILVAMGLEIPFGPLFKITRQIRKES